MNLILNKKISYISFIIILFILTIASCGKKESVSISDRDISLHANLNYMREFSTDEVNIGLRVCYALKTKRLRMKADYNGQKYNMKSYQTDCDGSRQMKSFQTILNVLVGDKMTFDTSYQGPHLDQVPTDQNSPMKTICAQLFEGELPENTVQISEDSRIQFEFTTENGMDFINMHYGIKDLANLALDGYKTSYVEEFGIYVLPSSIALTGMVVDYYHTTLCADNDKQHTIAVELISGDPNI
jgi:hypothetical protein